MRSIFILIFLFVFTSCSQKKDEVVKEAIDVALTYLSKAECEEAISVLEDAGFQNNNATYLQVLASAYACKGGYEEIDFIGNDLVSIDASSTAALFHSMASFHYSVESTVDSANYVAIRTGLNYLLNSTTTPGQVARQTKFGTRKAGDMGLQALLLNVVKLGKFMHVYGNVNSAGGKGLGTATTNTCFINYTDSRAQALIPLFPASNNCNSNTAGHPGLSFAAADLPVTKRRLCEGLTALTNLIDILENIDVSSSSELQVLADVATQVSVYKTAAEAAGFSAIVNTLSQSQCETLLNTTSNLNDMQVVFAMIFEAGLE